MKELALSNGFYPLLLGPEAREMAAKVKEKARIVVGKQVQRQKGVFFGSGTSHSLPLSASGVSYGG